MAIPNIANINVGLPNDSVGSDSLYQAFTKTRDNFTQLAACASPYSNFTSGNGISTNTNSNTGTVTITNTGVTSIIAGTGVTINQSNGDVTISSVGNGNVGVTSIGINSSTINVSNSPIISAGNITLNLPTITGVAGSYINPSISVDSYGRITGISNNTVSGTVTSVGISAGPGIQVSNSPVTTSGLINVTNTGVTRVSAGPGIAVSSSNGNVTISALASRGTVTSVAMVSDQLVITGSPVTSSGTFYVNLPANVTASRFISNVSSGTPPMQVSSSTQVANLNAQYSGTVTDAAQPNITSLGTLSSLTINGNLTVNGNLSYINVESLNIQDPLIQLGGGANGTPLTGNDGKDRGSLLNYFTTAPYMAFMGYKNSSGKILLASNVSVSNEQISVLNYGNTVVGNLEANTINATGNANVGNIGATNLILTGSINATGNANVGNIGATNLILTGSINATGNANVGNISATNIVGTITTASQTNITTIGTLASLSVSGNANINNSLTASNLRASTKLFLTQSSAPSGLSDGDIYNTSNGLYGSFNGNSSYIGGLIKSFAATASVVNIPATLPNPTQIDVTYDSVNHNVGNILDSANGIFTVPVTGIYSINYNVEFTSSVTDGNVYGSADLYVNGGPVLTSRYRIYSPNATGSQVYIGQAGKGITWFLTTGNQVKLRLTNLGSNTLTATVNFASTLVAPVTSPT